MEWRWGFVVRRPKSKGNERSLCFVILSAGLSPSEQLPILEVDGTVLTQSKAILSYLAKEFSKSRSSLIFNKHTYQLSFNRRLLNEHSNPFPLRNEIIPNSCDDWVTNQENDSACIKATV